MAVLERLPAPDDGSSPEALTQWRAATHSMAVNLDEEKVAHRDAYMAAIAHNFSLRQASHASGTGWGGRPGPGFLDWGLPQSLCSGPRTTPLPKHALHPPVQKAAMLSAAYPYLPDMLQ